MLLLHAVTEQRSVCKQHAAERLRQIKTARELEKSPDAAAANYYITIVMASCKQGSFRYNKYDGRGCAYVRTYVCLFVKKK